MVHDSSAALLVVWSSDKVAGTLFDEENVVSCHLNKVLLMTLEKQDVKICPLNKRYAVA